MQWKRHSEILIEQMHHLDVDLVSVQKLFEFERGAKNIERCGDVLFLGG